MCDNTHCYVVAISALALISLPLPLLLLGGIAFGRHLRKWEWAIGVGLVVAAAPVSFILTAYFFLGLPFVALLAVLASVVSRGQRSARAMLIAPVLLYVLWWIIGGVWTIDWPSCGEGDNERSYVWAVGGIMLASPLAALLLTLEFGRVVLGRLLWWTPAATLW